MSPVTRALATLALTLAVRPAGATPCIEPYVANPAVVSIAVTPDQPFWQRQPQLVWNGVGYGILTQGYTTTESDVFFLHIDPSGAPLGDLIRVTDSPGVLEEYQRIVWTGREYGVAWSDRDAVYFTRLDATGARVGTETIFSRDSQPAYLDSLVWTGSGFTLTWEDARHGVYEIYLARLDTTGQPLGNEVQITNGPKDAYLSSLVWTGSGYGLAWGDDRPGRGEVYFTALDVQGIPIGSVRRVTNSPDDVGDLTLVGTPSGFGLAWTKFNYSTRATVLFVAMLGPEGGVTAGPTTVMSSNLAVFRTFTWTGSEFGLAWSVFETPRWRLRFVRVNTAAEVLDGPLMVDEIHNVPYPSIAWNGSGFGIATTDSASQVLFHHIGCVCLNGDDNDADGVPACVDCDDTRADVHPGATEVCDGIDQDCNGVPDDGLGFSACGMGACTQIAANCFMGVPQVCHPGTPSEETCDGVDNDCDGLVDGPSVCQAACAAPDLVAERVLLSPGDPTWAYETSMAWTGSGYVAVWAGISLASPGLQVAATDTSGQPLGSPITIVSQEGPRNPSLVWNGSELALVWDDYTGTGKSIFFLRLDAAGNPKGPPSQVTAAGSSSQYPALAWTGTEYGLVWEETTENEIHFARLDPGGEPIAGSVRVSSSGGHAESPLLAWTGAFYGVTWNDNRDGPYQTYFASLDAAGQPTGIEMAYSDRAANSYAWRILSTGEEFTIFWERDAGGGSQTLLTRLGPFGVPVAPDVVLAESADHYVWPEDAVWTGAEYGYLLNEYVDSANTMEWFVRLSALGAPIGEPLEVNAALDLWWSKLVWNGQDYAIVRSAAPTSSLEHEVYWQAIGCSCVDGDGDGVSVCRDCNDADPRISPSAPERCNGLDDNCNGLIDEDSGLDVDEDGVDDLCDNCPTAYNPSQSDIDTDRLGDSCDNCPAVSNVRQEDADGDLRGDVCDNCPLIPLYAQGDLDGDGEGDICDLDDGVLFIMLYVKDRLAWQQEMSLETFNIYRGSIDILRATGEYTQDPQVIPAAERHCGLAGIEGPAGDDPAPGRSYFYLMTGTIVGLETDLGFDSSGAMRTNSHPCP